MKSILRKIFKSNRSLGSKWMLILKTFRFKKKTIMNFWSIFCRINNGDRIGIDEFLNFFDFDTCTPYVGKCFSYFNISKQKQIDFFEFIVCVWCICITDPETLVAFSFDIYDLDSDGELSYPELESMVKEFYGKDKNQLKQNALASQCLNDALLRAEYQGGVITLESYKTFLLNHSMILFPIFQIQRSFQIKVIGMKYWDHMSLHQTKAFKKTKKNQILFHPRDIRTLMQTYQKGGEAAIFAQNDEVKKACI